MVNFLHFSQTDQSNVSRSGSVGYQSTFLLVGSPTFGPFYVPTRFVVNKERELNEEGTFCGGENVEDTGSKNREIHISGPVLEREKDTFHDVLDANTVFDLVSPVWSGEVRIKDGELEGPTSYDPRHGEQLFKFTLNVISTGTDEADGKPGDGIISDGSDT